MSIVLGAGCKSDPPPVALASVQPSATVSASPHSGELADAKKDEKTMPVYPLTNDPPDPLAERYCDAVYERAEKQRKQCCPTTRFTPVLLTPECVRTLSSALRSQAVTLGGQDLAACEAAVEQEAKACDWGGAMPAACEAIVRGVLGAGAVCRSSLECRNGLVCVGLGATKAGKCAAPLPEGAPCGDGTDTLGAFIRQDAAREHPECEGSCKLRRCVAAVAVGGKCASSIECVAGARCQAHKCSLAPLPQAGENCEQGVCTPGYRCVFGKCSLYKRLDAECTADVECRSGFCMIGSKPRGPGLGASAGRCALNCQIIRTKPTGSAAPVAPRPAASAR